MLQNLTIFLQNNKFLFQELVKRDFKQKYKRTVLGMGWSVLSPLLTLLVMNLVFGLYFARGIPHYTTFLFSGNLLFSYYRESTSGGMNSLLSNAHIFTKINVPKYIFLLSRNVSALINFGLTLLIYFIFCFFDDIKFSWLFLSLGYPVLCLVLFNIGTGLVLSALYVFYRDMGYLYDIFTLLLMYCSAIFYNVDVLPARYQGYFMLNPVYTYIKYFRMVVLQGELPSLEHHALCAFYALMALALGAWVYKKYNHEFLYYV
jgi:ABC-2 type transport system permease protein